MQDLVHQDDELKLNSLWDALHSQCRQQTTAYICQAITQGF